MRLAIVLAVIFCFSCPTSGQELVQQPPQACTPPASPAQGFQGIPWGSEQEVMLGRTCSIELGEASVYYTCPRGIYTDIFHFETGMGLASGMTYVLEKDSIPLQKELVDALGTEGSLLTRGEYRWEPEDGSRVGMFIEGEWFWVLWVSPEYMKKDKGSVVDPKVNQGV